MNPAIFLSVRLLALVALTVLVAAIHPAEARVVASNNIPLDSPVYSYLEKLASLGLITSDWRGIRPMTKAEAARLVLEAEDNRNKTRDRLEPGVTYGYSRPFRNSPDELADDLIDELRHLLEREISLRGKPDSAPLFAARPINDARMRYVYLEGIPRSYERLVRDPGGGSVFGIGQGLRPSTPFATVQQHGSEGTPLLENNEGVIYGRKSNVDLRFSSEGFFSRYVSALVEPMFLYSEQGEDAQVRLHTGYAKLGGGGFELEVGRDANWLGLGERGAITLSNNAQNFDLVKLSSPEPLDAWFLGALKYTLIFSRFNKTVTNGAERRPFFVALKVSLKPVSNLEVGLNLGRQVGGPGVDNSLGSTLAGLIGGQNNDNSNSLAGLELRWRLPFLRNTEVFGEFSGEDNKAIWPIVYSYMAGIYIPRLTADGRNDFRFEYFFGHNILYTNTTFPEGYIYHGLPIGDSQGGATQDFFFRFRHWFSVRHTVALEYFHTDRGETGRLAGQAIERKNSGRAVWNFPLYGRIDVGLMYGWERVNNVDLVGGVHRTNQLGKIDLTYRY